MAFCHCSRLAADKFVPRWVRSPAPRLYERVMSGLRGRHADIGAAGERRDFGPGRRPACPGQPDVAAGNARRLAGRTFVVLAVSLGLAGLTGAAAPGGVPASGCSGRTMPPNPSGFGNSLQGVAVLSSCSAWAVGGYAIGSTDQTLIVHWNGTRWRLAGSPNPSGDDSFNAVSGSSSRDIWAVGQYSNGTGTQTLIAHWGGTRWRQVPSPNPAGPASTNVLYGVAALSAGSAWAVGYYFNGTANQTLIVHWNGTRWRQVPSPDPGGAANYNVLTSLTALSAGNIWAVGGYSIGTVNHSLIAHWNGARWRPVPSPGSGLDGVAGASPRNIWAVGEYSSGLTSQTLIVHWNGIRWRRVPSPDPGSRDRLLGVAILPRASAVAAGYYSNGSAFQTLIVRWNGTMWRRVPSLNPGGPAHDNFLFGVGAASTGTAWAVGEYSNGAIDKTLAVRCC